VRIIRISAAVLALCAAVVAGCVSGSVDVDLGRWRVGVDPGVRNLAYAKHIDIDYRIRAEHDGDDIDVYFSGRVSNNGPLTVSAVNVIAYFLDRRGRIVEQERDDVIDGFLGPHRSRPFHFEAEGVPRRWNGDKPKLDIYEVRTLE